MGRGARMIDVNRLAELRSEIGDTDLLDVVAIFLDETDEVIARLNGGLTAADLEGQLHFLKGSALNLGLTAFAMMCQDGETRAARGDAALVNIASLTRMYDASKSVFLGALARDRATG